MRFLGRVGLVAVVLASHPLGSGIVWAAPSRAAAGEGARRPLADALTGQARSEYEGGRLLFRDGDFAGALIKLGHAYELSHDARLLWNMAACEKNQRHYAKTLTLLQRYQGEGGPLLSESDRQAAAALIQTLSSFVGKVRLTVSEPDAIVYVDGEAVGKAPLVEPLLLDIGKRSLRVGKPGFEDVAQEVMIEGAAETPVNVQLVKRANEGHIIVLAGADDAISLDSRPVGTQRWEGQVAAGDHAIRIQHAGKKTYELALTLRDNETRRLDVTLSPEGTSPWLYVAGATVLAMGAVVGGYFLFKPAPEGTDPSGTLGTAYPALLRRAGR